MKTSLTDGSDQTKTSHVGKTSIRFNQALIKKNKKIQNNISNEPKILQLILFQKNTQKKDC